jgi:hypothetical protein
MTDASRGEAIAALRKAKRLLKDRRAAESLIDFTEATMPDPSDPEDADKTRYDAQYFHRALAAALEEVEAGRLKRLIITFPPRHGKSELTSKRFVAWYVGKDPTRHVALGTYNQEFADDLFFVGRGGSVTGRGGHGIIIDDPIKNSEEADSPTIASSSGSGSSATS